MPKRKKQSHAKEKAEAGLDEELPEVVPGAKAEEVPVEEPLEEVAEEASGEVDALKDRLLRLQADFDNFRKRIDRERKEWAMYAGERLVREILPVLDNFERGLDAPATDESVKDGFRLVYQQLLSVLEKSGVMAVEDAVGKPFDPEIHEAIAHVPSPDVPEGHVMAQTRRGYMMAERLLRPAQVVVSAGSGES